MLLMTFSAYSCFKTSCTTKRDECPLIDLTSRQEDGGKDNLKVCITYPSNCY